MNGGPLETVVAQIKVEEERKRTLTAEYEALEGAAGTQAFDSATVVREVEERAADVKAVLARQTPQARQMLRKLLDGKIAVEPVTVDGRHGFRLSGRLNVGRLLRAEVLRAIEAATAADEANNPTVVAPSWTWAGLTRPERLWRSASGGKEPVVVAPTGDPSELT